MRTTGVRSALVGLPRLGRRRIRRSIIVLFIFVRAGSRKPARAKNRSDFALFPLHHLIVGARRREPARGVRHGRRRRVAGSPFIAAL